MRFFFFAPLNNPGVARKTKQWRTQHGSWKWISRRVRISAITSHYGRRNSIAGDEAWNLNKLARKWLTKAILAAGRGIALWWLSWLSRKEGELNWWSFALVGWTQIRFNQWNLWFWKLLTILQTFASLASNIICFGKSKVLQTFFNLFQSNLKNSLIDRFLCNICSRSLVFNKYECPTRPPPSTCSLLNPNPIEWKLVFPRLFSVRFLSPPIVLPLLCVSVLVFWQTMSEKEQNKQRTRQTTVYKSRGERTSFE